MKRNLTYYFDILTLLVCVAGISLSIFLINLGIVMLLVRLFLIGSWKEKWEKIKSQRNILLVLLSLYFLHIIGLLWTDNLSFGWNELIRKLAFLVVPIGILAISDLRKDILRIGFIGYVISLLVGTIWGSINLLSNDYPDLRNLIPSTSHIRFSLNLVFAVLLIAKLSLVHHKTLSLTQKTIALIIIIWFTTYIIITQAITGITILSLFLIIYIPYYITKKHKSKLSYFILGVYSLIIVVSCFWMVKEYKFFFTPNKVYSKPLLTKTPLGNDYYNLKHVKLIENGNYIYLMCNFEEIKDSWKEKTGKDIGDDFNILLRYMNSISPYKDAESFKLLTDRDILNIQNGIANKVYTEKFSFRPRLYKMFYQFNSYSQTGQILGSSELQRLELWRNSLSLIRKNLVFGVGTGDFEEEFAKELCERESDLCNSGYKSHNQYLNITIVFGLIGLFIFLFWIFYPPIKAGIINNYIYFSFLFIILTSMLTEDTLDNIAGRMFYIFFASIMLFNVDTIKEFLSPKSI
ncbi:MAG: O-antigen ligase family protein [Bacteroidales bacterium]|jgi:hypothetical protein|nr:O-antigen ligase family protein [Bacteroidales bacterium]MDD4704016.1 O-antigen ligase family protein [Bacteroidales bacterium]